MREAVNRMDLARWYGRVTPLGRVPFCTAVGMTHCRRSTEARVRELSLT